MDALVIGVSGLVGAALARALEASSLTVCGTFAERAVPGAVALDVRDQRAVQQRLTELHPKMVFLAVNVPGGVDSCEEHPDMAEAILVDGTRHVAETASVLGTLVVLYSSDHIFDGGPGPYGEDDKPNPTSVYGRAKWSAEEAVRAATDNHLILRTTMVFGWDRASKNFAMQVWEHLGAGQPMCVPNDQWENPTLVDYLAEASVRLVQLRVRGVVNVVGKDRVTRAEFALTLARSMALDSTLVCPVTTEQMGLKAARPLQGGLRTERLQALLETEPPDLAESLKRFRRQWRVHTHVVHGPAKADTEAERRKQEILTQVRDYYQVAHAPRDFMPFKSRVNYAGRVYGAEELVNLVDAALDFWLTLGPYGDLFEGKLRKWLGARDVVLVNSGSTANLTAVMALMSEQFAGHLEPGDEVLTPAVTFPTTLAPIVHCGMVPVFVDIELSTYNVNPRLLEEAVSPKTRAIMLSHTLGNPFDLDAVMSLARRKRLLVVEDSCDALGSLYRGRPVGTFGDLATISFFPAHHITMGEGGAVVVNNPRLARIVRSVRDWGRDCWCAPGESNSCGRRFGWQMGELPRGYDHKYTYTNIGYNFKPTDLQAAVGVAQLDRLEEFVAARRRNFQMLYDGLKRWADQLILPTWDPHAEPAWFGFPITVREGVSSEALIQHLEQANIETRRLFGGNILKQPAYQRIHHRVHGTLTVTDRVMRDTFFIGVYPGLTDAMIEHVLDRFHRFFFGQPA